MQAFADSISRASKLLKVLTLTGLLTGTAIAQIDTGVIAGSVHDASGASIQNAGVTLTNKATNQTLTTTTNQAGEYQFNALHAGSYSVKAASPGFSAQEFSDVQVDVDSRVSRDFSLQVGNVSQTLEVHSTTPLLDTQTAELGGVVHEQQIGVGARRDVLATGSVVEHHFDPRAGQPAKAGRHLQNAQPTLDRAVVAAVEAP